MSFIAVKEKIYSDNKEKSNNLPSVKYLTKQQKGKYEKHNQNSNR